MGLGPALTVLNWPSERKTTGKKERKNVSARCRPFARSTLSYVVQCKQTNGSTSLNNMDGLFCRPLDLGVGQLRYPVECRVKGDGIRIANSEARSCVFGLLSVSCSASALVRWAGLLFGLRKFASELGNWKFSRLRGDYFLSRASSMLFCHDWRACQTPATLAAVLCPMRCWQIQGLLKFSRNGKKSPPGRTSVFSFWSFWTFFQ